MRILGIETSCDETAASIIEVDERRLAVCASVVNSQVDIHATYGGVVPEVAARHHVTNMMPLLEIAFSKSQSSLAGIDAIAVTQGPGLAGALMVGLETAKVLAWSQGCTLVPVNHLFGHVWSWLLPAVGNETQYEVTFPHLSLIVSGGHTELVLVRGWGQYEVLGRTLDDAVGEAFDKVAKILQLSYPGGPAIARAARLGKRDAYELPQPLLHDKSDNFSFAGLKTAVLYQHRNIGRSDSAYVADMAASFEAAAIQVLVTKLERAVVRTGIRHVSVVGGVSANQYLRERLLVSLPTNVKLWLPELTYTGDNAAMIALAGYISLVREGREVKNFFSLSAQPNLEVF